jgi:hypothetical protein
MNILLWILQVVLLLLCFAGGGFKVFAFRVDSNIPSTSALPRGAWAVLGLFEIVCGLLLVVPGGALDARTDSARRCRTGVGIPGFGGDVRAVFARTGRF